jgi:TPR repeat protein
MGAGYCKIAEVMGEFVNWQSRWALPLPRIEVPVLRIFGSTARRAAPLLVLLLLAGSALAQTAGFEGLTFIKKLKLARAGDVEAQLSVAIDYEQGLNQARKDPVQAARWFREAALAGNLDAQFRLSRLITKGAPGLASDLPTAIKLLQDAANRGYPQAQNELGIRLQKGDGIAADPAAAAQMFQKAAAQGNIQAQVNLGLLQIRGLGVKQDFDAAFKLFEDASATGDPWALNNLGSMYEMGWGTPADKAKARSLYEQAAAKGNTLAQENLKRLTAAASTAITQP